MMYELGNRQLHIDTLNTIRKALQVNSVAITGAGISVASGLPLGTDTIQGVNLTDFFGLKLWMNHPVQAFNVFREILKSWRAASPSVAHRTLSRVGWPIITQNIDGLHRDAGSENVIELHGNLRELICRSCHTILASDLVWEFEVPVCPTCTKPLFPGVTLEGDPVRHIVRAVDWVSNAQCLLIVGTQLAMDPIRNLREIAQKSGSTIIWVSERAEEWIPEICVDGCDV
ncbi:SIR2 family NAD-dependent protein deacylase [Alicyclobacillus fodiniaquatilis]|uniref:protein acetyllysine N-acetyltransferase n=1 Tax=Alicyclobacillus fodiniaquatilis TaxID=1661150 RepID=A0ABW4JFN4_9BACL